MRTQEMQEKEKTDLRVGDDGVAAVGRRRRRIQRVVRGVVGVVVAVVAPVPAEDGAAEYQNGGQADHHADDVRRPFGHVGRARAQATGGADTADAADANAVRAAAAAGRVGRRAAVAADAAVDARRTAAGQSVGARRRRFVHLFQNPIFICISLVIIR